MPVKQHSAPFHLAFPVHDLEEARAFYREVLGCEEGRSSDHWVDYSLYGNQIVTHLCKHSNQNQRNDVDGQGVPVPHFGVVLTMKEFDDLAARVRAAGIKFELEPQTRFEGQVGEQATMFFKDPSGNALEFKALADLRQLFMA